MAAKKKDAPEAAELYFDTFPKNAEVWVGKKQLGLAPGPFSFDSEVDVTLRANGFKPKTIRFGPKDAPKVEVRLFPILSESDMQWMNIPPEFWRAKLDMVQAKPGPVVSRYVNRIEEMIRKPAGLLITGGSGVGKTAIAAIIMKRARVKRFSCLFVSVWELREMIRNQVPFDDSKSMVDRCREVDLLVIDHLREEDLKDHYVNLRFVEELVAHRGQHRRTTLITTSMPPAVIAAEMKSFMKMTQTYLVHFHVEGEDLRRKFASELANDVLGKNGS